MRVWQAHSGAIGGLAFSPDGSRLVTTADGDPAAMVWDRFGPSEPLRLSLLQESALSVAFAPDGRIVAIGRPWAVELWSIDDLERLVRLESLRHYSKSMAFSRDGRTLLSAGLQGRRRNRLYGVIWDVAGGRVMSDNSHPTNDYRGLTFAVDASRYVWAHGVSDPLKDMPATLTDVSTGVDLAVLNSPGQIVAAAMAPDGETLATAVKTHVYFWPLGIPLGVHPPDAAWLSSQELRRLDGREKDAPWILPATGLAGADERIDAVSFTPDGRRILTGSATGMIRLWLTPERLRPDLTGNGPDWYDRPETEFDWQLGAITTIAVAPDGLTAAAGCLDGRVVVWDLDS